jgi:hypothetical protein
MVNWQDFFLSITLNEQVPLWVFLIAFIIYAIDILTAVFFVAFIRNKVRKSKMQHLSLRGIIGLFIGVIVMALNGAIIRLSLYLTDGSSSLLYLHRAFIYIIGLGIAIASFHVLILSVVSLPTNMKRIIRYSFIFTTIFSVVGVGFSIAINFGILDENLALLIFLGLTCVAMMSPLLFTILIYIESRRNANVMSRLRLRLMTIGSLAIFLEIFGLAITFVLRYFDVPFLGTYHHIILPILTLIWHGTFMIVFYYSIFTPTWLQRRMGILPPSFSELMKKRKEAA